MKQIKWVHFDSFFFFFFFLIIVFIYLSINYKWRLCGIQCVLKINTPSVRIFFYPVSKSRTTSIWSTKSLQTHIWISSKSPKSRTTFTSSLASSPSKPLPSSTYSLPTSLLILCWLQFGSDWGWEVGEI